MSIEEKYDDVNAIGWADIRLKHIIDHYGKHHFEGKTLLEVGAAWGYIGHQFSKMGAIVSCSDHYEPWVDLTKERYPHITTFVQNVNDSWDNIGHYDIIVHMGLLYHQPPEAVEPRLHDAFNRCDELILESSADATNSDSLYISRIKQSDQFQSWQPVFTDFCEPTTAYIERIIRDAGFTFTRELYNWPKRFLWFCKKDESHGR